MTELAHETIDVGDDLPPMMLNLSNERIRNYAIAAKMPGGRFTSDEEAQSEGLPGQIAPGNLSLSLFASLIRRALPQAKMLRLSGTFRALVRPNVDMVVQGVVTERHAREDGDLLECDVVLETVAGDRLVTGTATLKLPA